MKVIFWALHWTKCPWEVLYLQASMGPAPAPAILNESKDNILSHIWSHAHCLKFPSGYQVIGQVPSGPLIITHPTLLLLEQTPDR